MQVIDFKRTNLRQGNEIGHKIGMAGRSATLLEYWDNNLPNQHWLRGKGRFKPNRHD